jgi:cobalt/nickel transport system permease protein
MHIPDGFLDTKTIIATTTFSIAGIARALRNISRQLSPQNIPLMGLAAAFIFVAQMLNFPVAGGTSGHLIGAVLVSCLLGPSAAILVMTVVLIVQCFLFADGGVLSLGANIFNMGIIAVVSGYYIYRGISAIIPGSSGKLAGIAVAAWISTVVSAICCTGELAWSGTIGWSTGFPAMAGIHMIIGVGETIITSLVIIAIYRTRPSLFTSPEPQRATSKANVFSEIIPYGLLVTVGLVLFVVPFVTSWPDGLEKVASMFGFSARALRNPLIQSPLADYRVPGIGSLTLATAIAGLIGTVLVFVVSIILGRAVLSKSKNTLS